MKKNLFQQQQEKQKNDQPQQAKNYFDEELEVDLEEEGFDKEVLKASKPYEEYFQKFNEMYNQDIAQFQKFEENHQIPLTHPDYESLIQTHFLCYEKNMGLFDYVKSDNKLFDKICASFVFIDGEINQIEEIFYTKFLDKMTIYGELSDIHHSEDQQLKDGEAEIMISRMLGTFKTIYDIIKKLINYVTHLVNQLNLLYNKKDPIYKSTFKQFNLFFPLDTIGRALSMIYVLDQVVEQNEYIQQHWNFYKRMMKIIKSDPTKFNTSDQNLKMMERVLIRLDKTVLSSTCLQGVLSQNWDQGINANNQQQKNSNIPPMKNNKELIHLFTSYFNQRYELYDKIIGTSKEVFERDQLLPTLCVYALFRKIYTSEEDRKIWKNFWSLQKRVPFLEGHSQVLVYVSKFMMEVVPLTSKSKTMDPKDPVAFVKTYLQKLSQSFGQMLSSLYIQFTAWLVRMDSFATSQASFTGIEKISRDKAQAAVEDRIGQRVTLVMNGLIIAVQVRNLLQSLLLGHFGMEEQALERNVIQDVVLAVSMLKAIEYYLKEKLDAFQPAFLNREITKNVNKVLGPVLEKAKSNIKQPGGSDVVAALQIIGSITRQPLSPMKLLVLTYCNDFLNSKEVLKDLEREELRYIMFRLDKIVLLPQYIRKVTSSTYFYWCRDLLPLFFQTVYNNPPSAKRFQFLLNAVSDCSRQLRGCHHLTTPDELYESFRKYVVHQFHHEYLKPLAHDIEDFLRINIHIVLIDKIHGANPFKQQVKDIKRLLDVDQVLIFDSVVNLRTEINQNLNETFYNMNVINMYDMETYEQMRSLANYKFGLHLMNVYLPSQTIDQASFDLLNIIKNISGFISKYSYNMYTQTFTQISTESKQTYSIGISQISDSIRTHGLGILSTNVNSVYQYIRKQFHFSTNLMKRKIAVFSQFLFDDYIYAPLTREERYFKEMKDQLDGCYPFEKAEAFYKEVKKLGVFDDGKNFLDKFRVLITSIGNALGFVRLLRSASLNFCSKSIEFLPHGYEKEQQFAEQAQRAGFSESTQSAAKELDDVFALLKTNFSNHSDYLQMLVKVFEKIRGGDNKHLKVFYLIIPALTINFVDNMLMAKERLAKKNTTECFLSDDGFIIGLQYFLHLLDQKIDFDSLHWRKEIRLRFQKEIGGAKNITSKQGQQSARVAEEINMQKELSLRKLNMQLDEYQMLFFAFNSSKILFLEKQQ